MFGVALGSAGGFKAGVDVVGGVVADAQNGELGGAVAGGVGSAHRLHQVVEVQTLGAVVASSTLRADFPRPKDKA